MKGGEIDQSIQRMRRVQPMTRNQRLCLDAVAHLVEVDTDAARLKPDWAELEKNLMAVNDRRWKALTEAEQAALVAADQD